MVPTYAPTVVVSTASDGFPTGAIVIIALGGYLLVFILVLIVRKCIINKAGSCCPVWCSELCVCNCCCENDPNKQGCYADLVRTCDCNVPNKRQCMDKLCPTKQWCDDTFCCCFAKQPGGECCNCDGNSNLCGNCGNECCDCTGFNDCCNDCKCECCSQPESINCCCLEVKLSGGSNQPINQPYPGQQAGNWGQPGQQTGNWGPSGEINYGGPLNTQPNFHNPPIPLLHQSTNSMAPPGSFNAQHPAGPALQPTISSQHTSMFQSAFPA